MKEYKEARAKTRGICCSNCQENVNVHGCEDCMGNFYDDDIIYCLEHSISDCEHLCNSCMEKRK